MKRGSTHILRAGIWACGLVALFFCIIGLPNLIISETFNSDFDYGWLFLGMYIAAVPFFIALYHALRLLGYIDKNQAFSPASVDALRKITYAAYAVSGLFMIGMPYIFYLGDRDDAPGIVVVGLIMIAASFVVGTAAAVCERLFRSAVDIKTENDMTV